jgi:hypothetical protein
MHFQELLKIDAAQRTDIAFLWPGFHTLRHELPLVLGQDRFTSLARSRL